MDLSFAVNRLSRATSRAVPMALLSAGLLGLAGCATTSKAPVEQVAVARSAVTDAVSAGSVELAPLELRTAQEKLDRANAAMSDKAYDDARRYAEAAEADARLAAVTARSAKAQRAVLEVESGIRALREEIARNGAR